ncbi:hypothetical protein D3C73_1185520 [compost metagenome]
MDRVATRPLIIQGTDAGGVQRAVHAIGQLGTHRHSIEHSGEAQTRQLHAAWVDHPIGAQCCFDLRCQPGLVVVELTVVGAKGRFDFFDVELTHHTPVLAITPEF